MNTCTIIGLCSIAIILDFVLLLGLCACVHSPALQDIEEYNLQFWDRSQTSLDKLLSVSFESTECASFQCHCGESVQSGRDHYTAT